MPRPPPPAIALIITVAVRAREEVTRLVERSVGRVRSRQQRHSAAACEVARACLVAEELEHVRPRPDEADSGFRAAPREGGVLGLKAVARVDRVAARFSGQRDDLRDVEVGGGTGTSERSRFVRASRVQRASVVLGMDGDRVQAELGGRSRHADRDLSPVGDQKARDGHGTPQRVGSIAAAVGSRVVGFGRVERMQAQAETRAHVERIARQGYTVLERAIETDLIEELDEALLRLERERSVRPAMNGFEGHRTVRIYNLLAHARVFERVPVHRAVLPIVEGVIGEGCLVSSLSSIAIDPDEVAQPIHADDQLIPLAKPHHPIICNSMWALTDFTEANGATRLVPGSHRRENPKFGTTYETIAAVMPRGSVLVWDGALWHGGGANRTRARRTGIAMNYCAGFIRQQENQQLGVAARSRCALRAEAPASSAALASTGA